MGSPIQIPDLPPASIANNADQLVMRQGLTDYRVTVGLIRNINISTFTSLPTPLQSGDYFMATRSGQTYRVNQTKMNMPYGTAMWFYMTVSNINLILPGWAIVPNTGDSLLAVGAGGSIYNANGSVQGTWQQPFFSIRIDQIPAHSHYIGISSTFGGSGPKSAFINAQSIGYGNPKYSFDPVHTWQTGGAGSDFQSQPAASPPGSPNADPFPFTPPNSVILDQTWRPQANVGAIFSKVI